MTSALERLKEFRNKLKADATGENLKTEEELRQEEILKIAELEPRLQALEQQYQQIQSDPAYKVEESDIVNKKSDVKKKRKSIQSENKALIKELSSEDRELIRTNKDAVNATFGDTITELKTINDGLNEYTDEARKKIETKKNLINEIATIKQELEKLRSGPMRRKEREVYETYSRLVKRAENSQAEKAEKGDVLENEFRFSENWSLEKIDELLNYVKRNGALPKGETRYNNVTRGDGFGPSGMNDTYFEIKNNTLSEERAEKYLTRRTRLNQLLDKLYYEQLNDKTKFTWLEAESANIWEAEQLLTNKEARTMLKRYDEVRLEYVAATELNSKARAEVINMETEFSQALVKLEDLQATQKELNFELKEEELELASHQDIIKQYQKQIAKKDEILLAINEAAEAKMNEKVVELERQNDKLIKSDQSRWAVDVDKYLVTLSDNVSDKVKGKITSIREQLKKDELDFESKKSLVTEVINEVEAGTKGALSFINKTKNEQIKLIIGTINETTNKFPTTMESRAKDLAQQKKYFQDEIDHDKNQQIMLKVTHPEEGLNYSSSQKKKTEGKIENLKLKLTNINEQIINATALINVAEKVKKEKKQ